MGARPLRPGEARLTEGLKLPRYQIKRWTAFAWEGDTTSDRRDHMLRSAAVLHDRLNATCARLRPSCSMVQVGGQLQLVFSFNVEADTSAEAERQAAYWSERAAAGKIPTPRPGLERGGVKLNPPWGTLEARPVKVVV